MIDVEECLLYAQTVQSLAIKSLSEILKELLNDAMITFDEAGLKMVAPDGRKLSIVFLKLEAANFDVYKCTQPLHLGINMMQMNKLIKQSNASDMITFFVQKDNTDYLGIEIDNVDKRFSTTFHLKLLEMDHEDINIGDVQFESIITVPAPFLQCLCRNMLQLDDKVTIKSEADQLTFTCKGDFATQETVIGEQTVGGTCFSAKTEDVIEGIYSLRVRPCLYPSHVILNADEM
jgi:proliferating cell nuclear antigen